MKIAVLGAGVLLGVGCGAPAETRESVCPSCPARQGGESSDFGGTPHPCAQFERPVSIDGEGAAALGFDVASLEGRITRAIDAPLYWRAAATERVRGYEPETRIELNARVLGYTHIELDAQACTGTRCLEPGAADAYDCSDRLELDVEADVRTADGAIAAVMLGYALYGRQGFSFYEVPAGTLFADLRDVTGTLELPEPGLPIDSAQLLVNFQLHAERTSGEISPRLLLRTGVGGALEQQPIFGSWPEPPVPY